MENQEGEEKEVAEPIAEHITSETAREMDESSEITNMKKIEAALFIAGRFMTLQDLVMLTDVNPLMIKELLDKLIEKYNSDDSGIEIVVKENMWKMDVRQEYVSMINKLATGSAEFTKAEQETLAVIAYKQPVKQSIIIKIRGNKAYDHVHKFLDTGLVQAKRDGHTKELKLSDDFYEYFHLRDKKIERNEDGESMVSKEQGDNGDSLSDKQKNTEKDKNPEEDEENSGEKEVIEEKADEN